MSVVPKHSRILVTGANGFLASHVVNQLLLSGYRVRGTIREDSKAAWMKEYFSCAFNDGRLEFAIVPDMTKKDAYLEAAKGRYRYFPWDYQSYVLTGTSGILHVASDLSFGPDPNVVSNVFLHNLPWH